MNEKHNAASQIQCFLINSRKRKAIFSALLATAVLVIAAYRSVHDASKPYRAPVYCSTWDSATKIPAEYEDAVMEEYDAWCSYNKSRVPNEPILYGTTHSTDTSLIRNLHNHVDEYKPKNMAGEEFKKPGGFRVVAMIFCKLNPTRWCRGSHADMSQSDDLTRLISSIATFSRTWQSMYVSLLAPDSQAVPLMKSIRAASSMKFTSSHTQEKSKP